MLFLLTLIPHRKTCIHLDLLWIFQIRWRGWDINEHSFRHHLNICFLRLVRAHPAHCGVWRWCSICFRHLNGDQENESTTNEGRNSAYSCVVLGERCFVHIPPI